MNRQRGLFWLVFLAVAGVVALVPDYFFPPEDIAAVRPASGKGSLGELRSDSTAKKAEARPATAPADVPRANLFAAHSWYVAPPVVRQVAAPVAVAAPAPRPSAPPLPFRFIGRMDDGKQRKVFVLDGETLHVLAAGDVIDGTYRVERIGDSEMTLVYLPMHLVQSLAVGRTP
ncbi:hypothetical protein [Zestomonas carbonaria]|uniref:Secretion system X translation initiation factor n=1 Tax=Zestomonas carbonaria TaxID=2762745 RepID=A0A7U7IA47_9GAMM|nr:hypothetical protein [Pseudomonas carbonaria]CAD5108985.1 hypothetical protein PSEWESI4_03281 [Pseudomonas carbonaria]